MLIGRSIDDDSIVWIIWLAFEYLNIKYFKYLIKVQKSCFQPTFSDPFRQLFWKSEIYEEGPNSRFRRFDAKNNFVGSTNITLNLYPYTLTLSVGMSATDEISNQHRL